MLRRLGPPVVLALGLCACASLGSDPAEVNCVTAAADTSGWVRVRTGHDFSFLLPPGFRANKVEPIDSDVRGFESETATLTLEYGHFPADARGLSDASNAGLECPGRIGGRDAVVVLSWPDRVAYHVGASWRDVTPGVHLWIGGAASTPAGQRMLLTVLRSVRFDVP